MNPHRKRRRGASKRSRKVSNSSIRTHRPTIAGLSIVLLALLLGSYLLAASNAFSA